jgi:low molecular weight protein-tyrosine phosphatase
MPGDPFAVLFVCHANICRSPMAERLAPLAFGGRVRASSAGTHAWQGAAMHRNTAQVLAERGAAAGGFASRPVTGALLDRADLVLTMAREQRAACVRLLPSAVRRVFTLRQFGRLAAALPDRPGDLAELVAGVRGLTLQPVHPDEDDLADPVLGPVAGFRACADEMQRVFAVIAGT